MNAESLILWDQKLSQLMADSFEASHAYKEARTQFESIGFEIEMALAKKIASYRVEKKNIGIEMARIMVLEDAIKEDNQEYIDKYEQYKESLGTYKGLDRVLESLRSGMVAIQSLMKYAGQGDMYGKVD